MLSPFWPPKLLLTSNNRLECFKHAIFLIRQRARSPTREHQLVWSHQQVIRAIPFTSRTWESWTATVPPPQPTTPLQPPLKPWYFAIVLPSPLFSEGPLLGDPHSTPLRSPRCWQGCTQCRSAMLQGTILIVVAASKGPGKSVHQSDSIYTNPHSASTGNGLNTPATHTASWSPSPNIPAQVGRYILCNNIMTRNRLVTVFLPTYKPLFMFINSEPPFPREFITHFLSSFLKISFTYLCVNEEKCIPPKCFKIYVQLTTKCIPFTNTHLLLSPPPPPTALWRNTAWRTKQPNVYHSPTHTSYSPPHHQQLCDVTQPGELNNQMYTIHQHTPLTPPPTNSSVT